VPFAATSGSVLAAVDVVDVVVRLGVDDDAVGGTGRGAATRDTHPASSTASRSGTVNLIRVRTRLL
jgi:hypothetical protein